MYRILTIIMALVMLFIGACFSESELQVTNNSMADAWVRVGTGSERHIPAKQTRSINVSGPYTIALNYRGHHILPGTIYIDLSLGTGQSVSLEPNCGALQIRNISNRNVLAVYLSPAGSGNWGENVLEHSLESNTVQCISLEPDHYDLKLRDQNSNFYYFTGISILLDQDRIVDFRP
ncbi:MAG TPA: hypothetical protein PLX77_02675 [Candidatus Cloacimonadota bacterium]|nr:hypothetical protein [Candidatus Cloacimonadota bacterium]